MLAIRRWFTLEQLRRFEHPGLIFSVGLIAGLLVFLLWLSLRPSNDQATTTGRPVAATSTSHTGVAGEDGVLESITGGPGLAPRSSLDPDDTQAVEDELAADEDAPVEEVDDEAAEPVIDDDGFVDAPGQAVADAEEAPVLRPYFIEVLVGPGVVELLEVNATSSDHARAIVRDFHGDARILRGPSLQRLE